MEMNAIHVKDVDNPQRNYPIAIMLAALGTVIIFVLGTLAIAFVIKHSAINQTQRLLVAYDDMFKWAGLESLAPVMAIALAVGVLAGVVTWVGGPSSGLLSVAKAGYLPRWWQHTNAHGMATHILLVQALIVSFLAILFVVLPSVQAAYQILSQLTVILYLVMYMLMFSSAIYLRFSQPKRPRPYRIPGGEAGMWLIGGIGCVSSALVFVLSFVPPDQIKVGSPQVYVALLAGLTIFFVALPFVIYALRKPHWRDEHSDFAPFTWELEQGHPGLPSASDKQTGAVVDKARSSEKAGKTPG
jgi:putative glutamate/gamma-aminobutyrate antiporter